MWIIETVYKEDICILNFYFHNLHYLFNIKNFGLYYPSFFKFV